MTEWAALSLVLGIFSLVVSLLIYYAQTTKGRRVCWYRTSYKNHYWILLFNTSRRLLIREDMYKPIIIKCREFSRIRLIDNYRIDSLHLQKEDGGIKVDFEYMESRAFCVIELHSNKWVPRIIGFIRDGDIVNRRMWLGVISHMGFGVGLIISILASLLGSGLIILGLDDITEKAIVVCLVSSFVLGIGLYTFLESFRRIPDEFFKDAYRSVKERKRELRRRKERINNYLFEKWVDRADAKLITYRKQMFEAVQRLFISVRDLFMSVCGTIKNLFQRFRASIKRVRGTKKIQVDKSPSEKE